MPCDRPDCQHRPKRLRKEWARCVSCAHQDPTYRAKTSAAISEARMAWCPPHLREAHKRLVKRKRIPSAVAREMILEQARVEAARNTAA